METGEEDHLVRIQVTGHKSWCLKLGTVTNKDIAEVLPAPRGACYLAPTDPGTITMVIPADGHVKWHQIRYDRTQ